MHDSIQKLTHSRNLQGQFDYELRCSSEKDYDRLLAVLWVYGKSDKSVSLIKTSQTFIILWFLHQLVPI